MKNSRAFTLIELLVVVLIIGILAAVALPQYRYAVAKSQYATLKNLALSIAKAQEVYYLANGTYTTDFADLDIQMPADKLNTSTSNNYKYNWGSCWLTNNELSRVDCRSDALSMSYRMTFANSATSKGRRSCLVLGTTDLTDWRNKICQAETGRTSGTQDTRFNQITYGYR